jgi:prepilin-type N-terminal cleavage/methylation domain-containing protein
MPTSIRVRGAPVLRAGFSLLEVVVAMTIFLVVLGFSLPFFNSQSRAVSAAAGTGDMYRNIQFALAQIDRDLRMAGAGTYSQQPMLVEAHGNAITFNANLITSDSADVRAVNYDPDADPLTMISLTKATSVTLPLVTKTYPDTDYILGGIRSPAETISYWVSADSSTALANDYILWRRENQAAPVVVAKGIMLSAGQSIFSYVKADTGGAVSTIASGSLPLYHNAKIHGSPSDTGAYATIDSIRVVTISLTGSYYDPRKGLQVSTVSASVRVANSGLVSRTTCGETPIFGKTITVTTNGALPVVTPWVTLAFAAAIDEAGGEKDVEQYAIFRRAPAAAAFDEPIASFSAGLANYTYTDVNVQHGDQWVYGVAAVDCSPAMSSVSLTSTVTVP